MRSVLALAVVLLCAPLAAEIIPEPGTDNPRIQTVRWQPGETIQLTALPATGLTIVFEPGEQVTAFDADASLLDTRISSDRDGLLLLPLREGTLGLLRVSTSQRSYVFSVRTGRDLMAAYLVRLEGTPSAVGTAATPVPMTPAIASPLPGSSSWSYRLRGDRAVQPAQVIDDGSRTYITFTEGSALPAIFAVGPTGDELLVNGYMRGNRFIIDQVWSELVFRIDAKKATARRQLTADNGRG